MLVTLDGQRLSDEFSAQATLRDLIDRVRDRHLDARLVVGVRVNGRSLEESELDARLQAPLAGDEQVDLESDDPRALAAAALHEAAERIAAAASQLEPIGRLLESGEIAGAQGEFAAFLDAWRDVQQTVSKSADLLRLDLEQHAAGGRRFGRHLSELLERLRELRDAFEARDTVLLSDLIQYEWPEICNTWQDLLHALADSIADPV